MKVLVTGANGQVGWELSRRGVQLNLEILALDRTALNIVDSHAVDREVSQPGVVLSQTTSTTRYVSQVLSGECLSVPV